MEKLALEFHPEAATDYFEALTWYQDRSVKAARSLEAEFVTAMDRIQDAPDRWPIYLDDCHRFLLRRFPFQIIYRMSVDKITVIAVSHFRRSPGYWKDRI